MSSSAPKRGRPAKAEEDRTTRYAREVVEGKRVAGPHVRAACARHLKDLAEGPARGLVWDLSRATRAIRFFETVLKLNGGQYEGVDFKLLGWQSFVIGNLFGWQAPGRGKELVRRFSSAYIETAKGSGKSPLVAGVGMYGLVADGEDRAEIYAAGTKKDQAMILFRDAVAMYQQSPELLRRLVKSGTGEKIWNLAYTARNSWFRPIAADDNQSGPRPHMALIDEVHEHKTNTVIELLRAGTKSRRQALILMITNSGSNVTGPCWEYHQYAAAVSAGTITDDSFFGYVCALDEGDDPFKDEECWPKVNPSLQESDLPGVGYIRKQVNEARGMPAKEAIVRRLNFCQWTGAEAPWVSRETWMERVLEFDWETLRGRRAVAGLDLASTTDLTALVFLVEPQEAGKPWLIVPFPYMPYDSLKLKEERDKAPYDQWRAQGFLHTTPGAAIRKRVILQRLSSLCDFFDIIACGYDRWRIEDLLAMAEDEGITLPNMVAFGQGYQSFSPAVEKIETMILDGSIAHSNHPVLNWCVGNTVMDQDGAGNRKPSKAKATNRIDLAVAAIMAAGLIDKYIGQDSVDDFFNDPIMAGV